MLRLRTGSEVRLRSCGERIQTCSERIRSCGECIRSCGECIRSCSECIRSCGYEAAVNVYEVVMNVYEVAVNVTKLQWTMRSCGYETKLHSLRECHEVRQCTLHFFCLSAKLNEAYPNLRKLFVATYSTNGINS